MAFWFPNEKSPLVACGLYNFEMTWLLAVIFRPIAALILFGLICLPARIAVQKWMPEGKFKRVLLLPLKRKTTGNP